MSLLYFFPNRDVPPSRNIFTDADRELGLDAVLRDASLTTLNTMRGPSGDAGYLVMASRPDFDAGWCQFQPEKQTWLKVSDKHWLGYWNEHKPGPERLARPKTIDGEKVDIDGREWIIPICGPYGRTLPFAFTMGLDGEWRAEVRDEYHGLMKACEQSVDDADAAQQEAADYKAIFGRQIKFCCQMLAVNYHVGPREASVLRILTQESYPAIIRAAHGHTTYGRELEAKKADAAQVAAT